MPRKAELQAEENAVNSPLRRSSRITISAETTVKSIKTRRSSTSSENADTQEKSESKPIRARRASVTKDEPEKKSTVLTKRRSSVTEESQTDTPKSIRTRRSSANEKNDGKESNVKDEIKKATHRRRSQSVEAENLEVNEKSTVKTRRQSLDSEENPPEIKRVTRSRRSSVDISEETEPQTPKTTKNKKKLSVTLETLVDKKAVVMLTPVKRKPEQQSDLNLSIIEELSFTEERIPDESGTSVHDTDSKQMVDSNFKSAEKLTPPKRKSPRLSRGAEMLRKLEFTEDMKIKKINLVRDIDVTQETNEMDVNTDGKVTSLETTSNLDKSVKLSEDNLDSAAEIRGRNSISNAQTEESIGSPIANLNLLNKEILSEDEDPDKSPINSEGNKDISSAETRKIENNLNDSITKETVPATSQSSKKIEVVVNRRLSQTPISKKVLSLSRDQLDSEDKIHLNGSVSLNLHESKEEHILNTSTGSNSSDKENICKLDNSTTNLLKTKDELKLISQEARVQRVSNVFRPKQIDYSFVEPMEVDEKSMLNDTRNKTVVDLDETNVYSSNCGKSGRKSTDDSIDESFNLCLNVTNSEHVSMHRKSQSQHELDESKKKDSLSEEKVDIQVYDLSNQNKKNSPTVEKQNQEELKHNLLLETKLEIDEVKIDDSSDYEFNFETDEDELDPEGKRERKYIENNSGDISSHISITEKNTEEEIDVSFKDKTKTAESIIVANETNIKLKKKAIHLNESKHEHIDEKSVDASRLTANDGCETKGHYDISNQQLSKEDNNETVITNKSDFSISEEQNKISLIMDNTENNAQSNTNKDIAVIKDNIEIENINEFDSNLRVAAQLDKTNIEHPEQSEILIKNSTCLKNINDLCEESRSTRDSVIFNAEEIGDSERNQVDKLTIIADNNDQTNQKIILKAEESNKNCDTENNSDATIEVKNNEMETTELVPLENNHCTEENNIKQVESSTLCEIEKVESQDLEMISQDHGSKEKSHSTNKSNIEQRDSSRNDNIDVNLSVSTDKTRKSCSKDESKVHLRDSSSQVAVGRSFSEDNSKNDTEVGLNEKNIGLTSDEKLNGAELAFNSAETTKVTSKDQNIESDSEQNDLLLKERNESSNKKVESTRKKHKTKKTKQNLECEHETENLCKSKLDIFLDKRLPELFQESDDYEDETNERNEFIDDMAEEGEEDTPSEDSNQIIEEGESINSTESEIDSDEDYDDNDSFICDEEEIELLSGEEYDLGQENAKKNKKSRIINVENYENEDVIQIKKKVTEEKKRRNSRIIDVEDCDDDVISIEKVKMKKPKTGTSPIINVEDSDDDIKIESEIKMQTPECLDSFDDEISFSKARQKEVRKYPAFTRKSSITVHENISVTGSTDATLSQRINSLVDSFCSKIEKGDISLNLSLEYDGQSKTKDPVLEKNHSNLKNANVDDKVIAEPPRKKRRLNSDLDNSPNQRSNNVIGVVNRKRKKKQDHQDRQLKKNKTKDLHTETFSLMNQLITDVKNRPLRTVKPSTSKVDINSSWIVDVAEVKPSTSVVTKRDIELYKKKKLHPKDFRQQMLNDSSRVQRMETKALLKKRGAYK